MTIAVSINLKHNSDNPSPTGGTYMYYLGSALILAVVAVVAASRGAILAAILFGVLALCAIAFIWVRRSRSGTNV